MNGKKMASVLIFFLIMFLSFFSSLGSEAVQGSASSNPMERAINLTFTVDPEGWIAIKGAANDTTTTTTSSSINFTMYGDFSITESESTTNITLLIPAENATKFPFNSSYFSLFTDYAEGLLDTDFNFTIILPSKQVLSEYITDVEGLEILEYFLNSTDFTLDAKYENGDGDFSIHHVMVANLTDLIGSITNMMVGFEAPFTLDLNYSQGEYDGSVRAYLMPGFPISDLEMDLAGNLTDVCFNGTSSVIYGNYFDMEINSTFLESIKYYAESVFNASIDQEGSLLNMTQGEVECTYVSVEIDPIDDIGATVTYRMCIRAEDGFLWVPLLETPPPDFETTWLYLSLNRTLYEIQDAEIQLVYTPADTKLDLTVDGVLPFRDLVNHLLNPVVVPDDWQGWGLPPELNSTNLPDIWLAMEMLNTTLHFLENTSLRIAYNHDNRKAEINFTARADVEGLYEVLFPLSPELEEFLELPPEFAQLLEAISTIRLANITAIHTSSTYANGIANLLVVQTFEGDVNAEINYLKHVIINYLNENSIETPPWQVLYLNNTEIDITGLKGYIKMDNASTEVKFEGITVKPPTDPINATTFKLDRFFNLTAEETFPGQEEQLNVTIIGVRNATHKITIYNASGVPEPDHILFNSNDRPILMAWNNVSLSDLRDLQFIISEHVLIAVTLNTPAPDDITETSIFLSWTENENPDFARYEVFQSTSSGVLGTSIANITDTENTTYEAKSLTYGTPYYFTIRVVDSFGMYIDSNQESGTTKIPIWAQSWFVPTILGIIIVIAIATYLFRRRGKQALTEAS